MSNCKNCGSILADDGLCRQMYCPYSKANQDKALKDIPTVETVVGGSNWENDLVQFARLIAEAQVAGAFHEAAMMDLQDAMDLDEAGVNEIIDRACDRFDKIKAQI